METNCHYLTLPTGLRVLTIHRPDATVDHCGVVVNTGSRDESPERYGLAHFVEHTIFKGTRRRRAWHILNRMELVGGELNAFTTKEETTLYTTYPAGNTPRALDLLADLVTDSVFPKNEIDKERDVVADEIDTYLDMPSEAIFDDFDELIFEGSPLAHPILGSRATLDKMDTEVCRSFLEAGYTAGNMVLFYSGAMSPDRFARLAEKYFARLDRPDSPQVRSVPPVIERFDVCREIGSHQAHTIMGARIGGIKSPSRYAMALLTNLLGGPGMNSLLNVSLRERRGLVYTIDASTSLLTDCGLFAIYFGCDEKDTNRCMRIVNETIERLACEPLSVRRLRQAQTQYLGQLTVGAVNSEQTALGAARATLLLGRALTIDETKEAIMSITPEQIKNAASQLSLSRLTLC